VRLKKKDLIFLYQLLNGLEPNVKFIFETIFSNESTIISLLQNDSQIFKVEKTKIMNYLVKSKIKHIIFYDIDCGTRYSIVFRFEKKRDKVIEILINEVHYNIFKNKFYKSKNFK
jgi:hypothetical protein